VKLRAKVRTMFVFLSIQNEGCVASVASSGSTCGNRRKSLECTKK
jgi:hypothetical protein